ncbi:hypothetical protein DMA10_00550 [Streptomyces sp. WAC 01420]|nr:hypothetical protein DLM49_21395 [Streptomyces sp. WAC 01438]RSN02265.1 hypothetical protein DMA10_00550 [Streptomyces sp. WAC 01420]
MRLNQLPADQSGDTPRGGAGAGTAGGSGTLQHSGGPWTRAAGTADDLRISTESTKKHLQSGHTGVSKGAEGLASVEVLTTVLASWEQRLEAVRGECESLGPKLRAVAKEMGEREAATVAAVRSVSVPTGGRE